MSLCRQRLHRLFNLNWKHHISPPIGCIIHYRHLSYQNRVDYVFIGRLKTPLHILSHRDIDTAVDLHPDVPTQDLLGSILRWCVPFDRKKKTALASQEGEVEGRKSIDDSIEAYLAVRVRDRIALADLPATAFIHLAQRASSRRLVAVLDCVAADVAEIYRGAAEDRSKLIRTLLKLALENKVFQDKTVLSLFRALPSPDPLPPLQPSILGRITDATLSQSTESDADESLMKSLTPLLTEHLNPETEPEIASERHSALQTHGQTDHHRIWLSFRLVQKFLRMGDDRQALNVFQMLITAGKIPEVAIRGSATHSRNFKVIILSTLVKACLYWSWNSKAIMLLADMTADDTLTPPVADFAIDVMYALLRDSSKECVDYCASLICGLSGRAGYPPLQHGFLRRFYESTWRLNVGPAIEQVYSHFQSPDVIAKHQYPPPDGPCLEWFLRHLLLTSKNMNLGRLLAKQVVELEVRIPLNGRANVIGLVALRGFSGQTRALWERFAEGHDRKMVVGNAGMMLRVVSLFASLVQREEGKRLSVGDGTEVEATSQRQSFEERGHDYDGFARRVLSEFRKTKEPLSMASHSDINALARAYFIVGDVAAGLDSFKVVLDRKEIPDLQDINVVLTPLARHDPRTAARLLERMIKQGLIPNAVTLGTVIHEAIEHRDMDLVGWLLERAHEYKYRELTHKSTVALIRASIEPETGPHLPEGSSVLKNLRRALGIIRTMVDSSYVPTPNLGQVCIAAALRENDPVMAFTFWKLLVKDKTEWDDRKQRLERRVIGLAIRRHVLRGYLELEPGRKMIEELEVKLPVDV